MRAPRGESQPGGVGGEGGRSPAGLRVRDIAAGTQVTSLRMGRFPGHSPRLLLPPIHHCRPCRCFQLLLIAESGRCAAEPCWWPRGSRGTSCVPGARPRDSLGLLTPFCHHVLFEENRSLWPRPAGILAPVGEHSSLVTRSLSHAACHTTACHMLSVTRGTAMLTFPGSAWHGPLCRCARSLPSGNHVWYNSAKGHSSQSVTP